MDRLGLHATIADYERQAAELLAGHAAANEDALKIFHERHPRFLDEKVTWLPKPISAAEIAASKLDVDDARQALARWYDFQDWRALSQHVRSLADDAAVLRFERAVEAVVDGDLATLAQMLREHPELVRARSSRSHHATLLHYIGANGVEGYRQRTPKNAVEVARTLLEAGADPDALGDLYDGQCTTMNMLVSSTHPAEAGLQVALVDLLLDFGAAVEPVGKGEWTSPLKTALAFGYRDAAEALVRRGARIENLAAAAGLGRLEDAQRLLPEADALTRHRSLALAAQMGHTDIVRLLLDAGEDLNRYNPEGNHSHSTPLHQAALAGHMDVVRLLVERGARLDIEDMLWHGTPAGWAKYNGQREVETYLRNAHESRASS